MMRAGTSLPVWLGLFCLVFGCLASNIQDLPDIGLDRGVSYLTQAGNNPYDSRFGADWQSVRTFRLMETLDRPLLVYVETSPANAKLYKRQYMNYINESLQAWSKALDGRLRYRYTDDPRKADIEVYWVPGFKDPMTAGLTRYRVGHAKIQIKTVGIPESDIRTNIMHEFGHAFGITGHSSSPQDVMVGVRRWKQENYTPHLSRDDVQAIRRLYSAAWEKGEDLYTAVRNRLPGEPAPIMAVQGK